MTRSTVKALKVKSQNAPPLSEMVIVVAIKMVTPTAAREAFLGAREFRINAKGEGSLKVSPGDYILSWRVYGLDGQKYSVELTSPHSALFKSGDRDIVGNHSDGIHDPVVVK